jgi:hypothetical protein
VSELVEEVRLYRLCSTCPRRDVRGRFLTGRVRSSRKSPRAAVPAMVATGAGKTERATTRKPLQMPRDVSIPGWIAPPGWQGPPLRGGKRRSWMVARGR